MAVKMWRPTSSIFVARHHPGDKDVAGGKDPLGGDDRLRYIGAKESYLPVDQPVQERQREEPSFCATVVDGAFFVFNGNHDGEWWNIDHTNQNAQVACDAYIDASIY